LTTPHTCPKCEGRKVLGIAGDDCPTCEGTGVVWEPEIAAEATDSERDEALDLTYRP
jgi:DnaJ-class molecular chaperone